MASYTFRKIIRKLPGKIIKAVPLPEPDITEGRGSRSITGVICKCNGFNAVLVVTDKTLFNLGYHEKITESLKQCGIRTALFCNISSEPNVAIIEEGRKAALELGADAIIALGGGAVMDACKMIAAAVKMKKSGIRTLLIKFLPVPGRTLPIIAIPSTAGTGAEITVGAVVTDPGRNVKASTVIIGLNVIHVILDCELTLKAPVSLTCACGIDALSHGLEGLVSDIRYFLDDKRKSMECVKTVFDNLPVLIEHSDDETARQNMCKAALYGGNAINKQLAGYVHAVAHSIGAKYKIPHGNAIAMALLPVMRAQKEKIVGPLSELSVYCGFASPDASPEANADRFLDELSELIGKCRLKSYAELIDPKDFPVLIKMITDDAINYSAPVVWTKKEITQILINISKNQG